MDLRLLPAAAMAWATAWAVVHTSTLAAVALGALLGVAGLLLLSVLLLLRRLAPQGRGATVVAAQLTVCCVAGAVVALSWADAQRQLELTGWPESVEQEIPVRVQLEVEGTPRETARPGPDGAARLTVTVTIRAHEQRGGASRTESDPESDPESGEGGVGPRWRPMSARAILLLPEDDAGHLHRGSELEGLVRPTPTEAGDRSTALLVPFGEGALVPVEAADEAGTGALAQLNQAWDRWRAEVRHGTVDLAAATHGDGPELLPGLILGDRSVQSQELTESMQVAGMTHLTVVSGRSAQAPVRRMLPDEMS